MKESKILMIIGKLISTILLIFWSSFFIEHLSWFFQESSSPPLAVYIISFFQFMLLAGYLIYLKWELTGSIIIYVSATIFLSQTANKNFFLFWIISILPALIFSYLFLFKKNKIKKV
jgi:hypothetical protein